MPPTYDLNAKGVGWLIRELRLKAELSQDQLKAKAGLKPDFNLEKVETDVGTYIKFSSLSRILSALGVTPEKFEELCKQRERKLGLPPTETPAE